MRKFIKNLLTSGLNRKKTDQATLFRCMLINVALLIGTPNTLILGIHNFLRGNLSLGIFELVASGFAILNLILLRKSKNIEAAGSFILILMLLLLNYLLVDGGTANTGLFWFYTYPVLAFFLKGRKRGMIWLGILFVGSFILYISSRMQLIGPIAFSSVQVRQLYMSLITVTLLVFFYELLKEQYDKLIKAQNKDLIDKKLIEEQFSIAENIQRLLIPNEDIIFGNLHISSFYKAAYGVGGDYYDFFQIDHENIAVIAGDVSGKGISAAMVMVDIRTIFNHHIFEDDADPAHIINMINEELLMRFPDDIFVTLSCYFYNTKKHELVFSHAGYGPFYFYSKKHNNIIKVSSETLPAGVKRDITQYQNRTVPLQEDDIIITHTDGITEATNYKGEMFGRKRLMKIVRNNAHLDPDDIIKMVMEEYYAFIDETPQKDDMALIIAKVVT